MKEFIKIEFSMDLVEEYEKTKKIFEKNLLTTNTIQLTANQTNKTEVQRKYQKKK